MRPSPRTPPGALEEDPLDEDAVRLLLRALLTRGLPADALRVYERFRRILADELGTDPAPPTQRLYAAALRGGAPPEAAAGRRHPADRLGLAGRAPTSSPPCARRGARPAGTARAWSSCPGNPASARAGSSTSWPARPGGPGARCWSVGSFEGERSLFAQPVMDALAGAAADLPGDRVRRALVGAPAVGRLVPELAAFADEAPPAPVSSAVERSQSFAAVAQFLRGLAADGPVLLVVDDLQRAGRSTVELLHYVARRLGHEQLLIAAALRSGEGDEVLELLGAVAATVPIGPLSMDAVAQLAGRAGPRGPGAGRHAAHRRHTLFVVEVLRALRRGRGPAGVTADRRVERVARTGADDRAAAAGRRGAGRAFDPRLAAALAGAPATEALGRFERALRGGLLVATGRQYEFAHDVVREVLLSTHALARPGWRSHARAADLLSARPGGGRPAR